MSQTSELKSAESAPRGRPRRQPTSAWSEFLHGYIRQHSISLNDVARKLGISISTLGRVICGTTKTIYSFTPEGFADAMGFDELTRRRSLALLAGAGVAFVSTAARSRERPRGGP